MLLDVANLQVRYGRIHAVKAVSLAVAEGEVVTILGANGAGKTSLLRAIHGAVRPAAGRVALGGRDMTATGPPARVRAGLCLAPEGRQIFVGMSVHENLLMGAYLRRDGRVRGDLDAVYERFPNLAQRRDMPASVLSGGEQQMLAIGRALLARPKLLMLDEPSLGLSPLLVDRLFDLLRELNRDGLAILLVEQNTRMALELAARGYVLSLGSVVLEGASASLTSDAALAAAYLGGAPEGQAA
jgi:branched-chain amino acid transport system ATP-binding protein